MAATSAITQPDVLYVDDGTSCRPRAAPPGSTCACTSFAKADHGSAVANAVARRLVIPPHRDGGQAQLIDLPMPAHPVDDPIAERDGPGAGALRDAPLDLEALAGRAYMSVRTFTRPVPQGDGDDAGPLADRAARAGEPGAAGDDGRLDEDDGRRSD